jgi:hypothetical protein
MIAQKISGRDICSSSCRLLCTTHSDYVAFIVFTPFLGRAQVIIIVVSTVVLIISIIISISITVFVVAGITAYEPISRNRQALALSSTHAFSPPRAS